METGLRTYFGETLDEIAFARLGNSGLLRELIMSIEPRSHRDFEYEGYTNTSLTYVKSDGEPRALKC
jgi:hypothetical protein